MYKCEYTEEQHIQLISTLKESNSMVILSGYDSELYNDMLSDWFTAERGTTAQMGLHRTEKLWMNFVPDMLAQGNEV